MLKTAPSFGIRYKMGTYPHDNHWGMNSPYISLFLTTHISCTGIELYEDRRRWYGADIKITCTKQNKVNKLDATVKHVKTGLSIIYQWNSIYTYPHSPLLILPTWHNKSSLFVLYFPWLIQTIRLFLSTNHTASNLHCVKITVLWQINPTQINIFWEFLERENKTMYMVFISAIHFKIPRVTYI